MAVDALVHFLPNEYHMQGEIIKKLFQKYMNDRTEHDMSDFMADNHLIKNRNLSEQLT